MRKIRTTMGAVVIQLEAEKKKKERLPIIDAKFTEDHFPLHPNDQA